MSRFSRAKKVHGQTVEGRRAVLESLRVKRDIERLIMLEDSELGPQLREIVFLATEAGIRIDAVSRRELESQSQTKKHQGVIAVVPDPRYHQPDDLLSAAGLKGEHPLLVMLDGIQDPHNLRIRVQHRYCTQESARPTISPVCLAGRPCHRRH